MQAFVLDGNCGFSGIWTAMTTPKSFNTHLLAVPPKPNLTWVRYTTGSTAEIQKGETLTGGTSSATAVVDDIIAEDGVASSSNEQGILFLMITSGTPTATGETWTGGTSSGTVVTAQSPMRIDVMGSPQAALITVETANVTFTQDGTIPTVASGTNYGHQVSAGQSYVIRGLNNLKNFAAINSAASNGAVLKYSLFY